jgi:large subunit ribosomal protein L17
MRHRKKGVTLDRKKAPRESMLKNLASSILIYEKVTTTEAKAKAVKPIVEKAITLAKKNDLASKKALISMLPQKNATKKLFEVLFKRYENRAGGYTRIIKLGTRQGDGAETAQIELV